MSLLRMAEREAPLIPAIHLSGDAIFVSDMSHALRQAWCKAPLWKADFVFAYISESISSHAMAEIWTAIANGIPVYLFFEPEVDRQPYWHCRNAAVQWMGFTTIHRDRLPELFKQVLADWCRQ